MSNEIQKDDVLLPGGIGNTPVLMVIDTENVLIHIGDPSTFKKKLLAKYARSGHTIKTVSFKEWKEMNLKLYEKINQHENNKEGNN